MTTIPVRRQSNLDLWLCRLRDNLAVRIPSVVYSVQENNVVEHTQTYEINFIRSPGYLTVLSNPAVEGSTFGRTLPGQPPNDL